ncbi:MAG: hydroxymethylglutaryl-CoA reductase [Prolixibacteraceae bacterium]|nr:hydroxymethylglutaryl-CoA reductase [Prolixibacteraceae bacterium]
MNHPKKPINGFSKFSREQRVEFLNEWLGGNVQPELDSFLHHNAEYQQAFAGFSENYLSNFYLPLGVVPNVLINGDWYVVPMVVEESSVVAAASRMARFWSENGGFKTEVLGTEKKGQVHFTWKGDGHYLRSQFPAITKQMHIDTEELTRGMKSRGGGINKIELKDYTQQLPGYYQVDVSFETSNAMGANFINSCLERMAETLDANLNAHPDKGSCEVLMSILSNYTPQSKVECTVECPVEALDKISGKYSPEHFSERFRMAVEIANHDVSRAVTHNKGIYNGVDGVVLATGNDWRAVEAAGHAFAARNGSYRSLSWVDISKGVFRYSLTIPLAVGTVGGLTKNHPLARFSLKMLQNPSAYRLMEIMAAMGMANNFSAITSLVTTGIQSGHMKMHLPNILDQLGASDRQKQLAMEYFADKKVTFSAVKNFLEEEKA